MIWSIDGIEWDVGCTIERVSKITSSSVSGMMLDKSYNNDVLGTYLTYKVKLAVPVNQMDKYAQIYELLTAPVSGHTFVFPYGEWDPITIVARVENISDVYVRRPNGTAFWKGISFEAVSNYPAKTSNLEDILETGKIPPPPQTNVPEGTVATFNNGEWEYQYPAYPPTDFPNGTTAELHEGEWYFTFPEEEEEEP